MSPAVSISERINRTLDWTGIVAWAGLALDPR